MAIIDVLTQISKREGFSDYRQIPLNRWMKFQKAPIKNIVILNNNVSLDSDKDFLVFYNFLNSIFKSRVNFPTAWKILNNGYF